MKRIIGLALALSLGFVPGLWAQASTGNIYGTVADASGAPIPGATVAISGTNMGGRTTQTGANGEFRFLNLDPGTYKLTVSMSGFATVNREVVVTTGQNVNLSFGMKVATHAEEVTVTAETPVVDTKRVGTATTLTKDELTRVPQGRDPWAILNQVPGVLVDRVSVAGNEAGQQSVFVGKGAQFTDTMWSYDGVVITDVTSYGASSTYFDFDSFDEVNVTTGGGDLKVQTGGLGLNFVTKRGTNTFHGSIRSFFSHDDLQSTEGFRGVCNEALGRAGGGEIRDDWHHDSTRRLLDFGGRGLHGLPATGADGHPGALPGQLHRHGVAETAARSRNRRRHPVEREIHRASPTPQTPRGSRSGSGPRARAAPPRSRTGGG